jgi:hypothetical protein
MWLQQLAESAEQQRAKSTETGFREILAELTKRLNEDGFLSSITEQHGNWFWSLGRELADCICSAPLPVKGGSHAAAASAGDSGGAGGKEPEGSGCGSGESAVGHEEGSSCEEAEPAAGDRGKVWWWVSQSAAGEGGNNAGGEIEPASVGEGGNTDGEAILAPALELGISIHSDQKKGPTAKEGAD